MSGEREIIVSYSLTYLCLYVSNPKYISSMVELCKRLGMKNKQTDRQISIKILVRIKEEGGTYRDPSPSQRKVHFSSRAFILMDIEK